MPNITNVVPGDIVSILEKEKEFIRKENYIQSCRPRQIDDYPYMKVFFADKGWISDVVSRDSLTSMRPHESLFIAAQTGSGKTTFLFNKCLPIALEENKRILYLCSRNALALQIKEIAMKDPINGDIYVGKKQVKEFRKLYTDAGLNSLTSFGGIDVYTYQSYIKEHKNINHSLYSFVAIDEAHFFLSDSTFNPFTELCLETILANTQHTRRIYLTATPKHAIDVIYEKEVSSAKSSTPWYYPPLMNVIYMANNYSYLISKFFLRIQDLISQINKAKDKYWLIFVRNIKIGEELKEALAELNLPSSIITADTDKEEKIYKNLLTKESLDEHILITTKVLDVGINLRTEGLTIVLFDDDITELKQMVGRKRVKKNEKLKVMFYTPSLTELKKRQRNVERNIQTVEKLLHDVQNNELYEAISAPLFFDGTQLNYNSFHLRKLKEEYNTYKNLINLLSTTENEADRNLLYANYILQNFDGVTYDEDTLFLQDTTMQLIGLLTKYQNKRLSSDEFKELSLKIVGILGDTRKKARDTAPSATTINKSICDYGYEILTDGNPVHYQVVQKEEI